MSSRGSLADREKPTPRHARIHESGVPFVSLERLHEPISGELTSAFERVLGASAFTLGVEVEQFEREFAEYCDVSHCVGVSSGTAALTLLLRAHGIGSGD